VLLLPCVLPATRLSCSVTVLPLRNRPPAPPWPVGSAGAWLPITVLLMSISEPAVLARAPPSKDVLPGEVLLVTVSVPLWAAAPPGAPPDLIWSPLKVQPVTVAVATLSRAPPLAPAVRLLKVLLVTVSVPLLYSAPPDRLALPPVKVQPVTVSVACVPWLSI